MKSEDLKKAIEYRQSKGTKTDDLERQLALEERREYIHSELEFVLSEFRRALIEVEAKRAENNFFLAVLIIFFSSVVAWMLV